MLIEAVELQKVFRVANRTRGPLGALRGIVRPQWREVVAVESVSFGVARGEIVGYIGPNGAGKSTTIKMLTGILLPSSGTVRVDGRDPHHDRIAHARGIGVVFGQRTQLWWDLPTRDSFGLLRHLYHIPAERFATNLAAFTELLDMGGFLDTPVRQLSLGQRMRAELAAALLHDPSILFLDEPTIGLDLVARERIRGFLQQLNREREVTIVLTTHDLGDIERLCQRVIVIDHGRVAYDGALEHLRTRFGRERTLVADLAEDTTSAGARLAALDLPGVRLMECANGQARLSFDREAISAAALVARVADIVVLRDLAIVEPPIEHVIQQIYQVGATPQSPPPPNSTRGVGERGQP